MTTKFKRESVMQDVLCVDFLDSGLLHGQLIMEELEFPGGRADVVALSPSGEIIVYELKLAAWRKALDQAYKARAFADRAFVVLPMRLAEKTYRFREEFLKRGVGLCGMCNGQFKVFIAAKTAPARQAWQSARVQEIASRKCAEMEGQLYAA